VDVRRTLNLKTNGRNRDQTFLLSLRQWKFPIHLSWVSFVRFGYIFSILVVKEMQKGLDHSQTISLNCPNCMAHLTVTVTLAEDLAARRNQYKLKLAKKAGWNHANPTDADLRRLEQLMCFPLTSWWKPTQPTFRPVVSDKEDEVGLLKDGRPRQTLDQVARRIHATIRASGEQSADALLASRRRGQAQQDYPPAARVDAVLEAVGAMIYAMEWTEPPRAVMGPFEPGYRLQPPSRIACLTGYALQLRRLFELMLVIDYGFPARPIRGPMIASRAWFLHKWSEFESFADFLVGIARIWKWRQALPNDPLWGLIAQAMTDWAHYIGLGVPVWDVATMIYYYCLHRKPVAPDDHKEGWTGYTGVLQEMIGEVPTMGTDRLERKLSLDAHLLIPRFVRDRNLRTQMLLIAQELAAKHGCQLAPPKMPKPPIWRRLFSQVLSHEGPEDTEERDDGDPKLLEGVGWESKGEGDPDPSCASYKFATATAAEGKTLLS
jgi:hypothetical protein